MKKNETALPPEVLEAREAYLLADQNRTALKSEVETMRTRLEGFKDEAKAAGQRLTELAAKRKNLENEVAMGRADMADVQAVTVEISAVEQTVASLKNIIATADESIAGKSREEEQANGRYWTARKHFLFRITDHAIAQMVPGLRLVFAAGKAADGGVLNSDRLIKEMLRAAGALNLDDQRAVLESVYGFR